MYILYSCTVIILARCAIAILKGWEDASSSSLSPCHNNIYLVGVHLRVLEQTSMVKKKSKAAKQKQQYVYDESTSGEAEGEDDKANFAANLLASMGVDDSEKPATEAVPENPIQEGESEDSKEDFKTRHPHLSSIHRKLRTVFSNDTDEDSEKSTASSTSKGDTASESTSRENANESIQSTDPSAENKPEVSGTEASDSAAPENNGDGAPKGKRRNRRREKLEQREKDRIQMIQDATEEAKNEEDKRLIELKGMGMMLSEAGLEEVEVQPDGHCLFHSICDQLKARKGIETDVQTLRSTLANFIREHPDDFVPYMLDEETGEIGNLDEYTKQLETTPLWGGDLEIAAASRAYETPIRVHFAQQTPLDINENLFPESDPLHLAYYTAKFGLGAHYNSLRDASEKNKS